MDLSLTREVYGAEDQSWLASEHGTDAARTITLDTDLIPSSVYRFGWVPSGLPVGQVTASGLYGPYDPEAEDGRETLTGFLLSSLPGPKEPGNPIAGALLEHGKILPARLPVTLADAEAAQADVKGSIIFVTRPGVDG